MNGYSIGVSFFDGLDGSLISDADYIELKKITPAEARRIRSMTDKPIYFHLQYDADGRFIKPSSRDFVRNLGDFTGAYEIAGPDHISFHFGPAAEDCRADMENELFIQDREYGTAVSDLIRGDFEQCRPVTPSAFDTYRSRRSIPVFDALLRYLLL